MLLGTLIAVPSASQAGQEMVPKITTQPRGVSAAAGRESVVFARAYGAGQLSFQWLHDGVPMDGAKEPVLRLASTSAKQAGAYQLVVSNPYGKATSDVARVTVEADGGAGFTPAGFVSCNAVGYVNVTLQPGLSLVVNPFFWGGVPAVSNVLSLLPNGMAIYQVTSSGFTANVMLSQWTRPDALLPLGEGFFVLNPFGFPVTMTMVGEVAQGDLQQVLPAAYSIAASLVPQAGGVGSTLGMPVAKGDEVWQWNSQTQSYLQYGFPEDAWQPQEPMISVAESFVVRKAATTLWRRIFHVNLLGWCPPPFPSPLSRVPMVSTAGQLHFFTYNPDPALGRVEGVGSDYFGQLYAGLSTNESELMPCGVPVRFFDREHAGYLDGGIVTTPGLPVGRDVQVQLRIWRAVDGASYEAARAMSCFTSKSELVTAGTEAPLVDERPGKPPRPVNNFRTLRPPQVPGIAIDPANGLVPVGQTATLTAVGAGPGTPSFQWSRNGEPIPGANGPQLVLSNMQRSDTGQYSVTIGNQTCASVSASVQLIVYEPIQILEQPADLDRIAGELARFAVPATGEPPLTYRWRTSALDPVLTNRLLNVNAAALVLSNVVDEAEGEYWVEIRSPYETIATSHAFLTVTNFLHIALDTPAWHYVTGGDQAWQLTEATHLGRSNIAVAGPIPWNSSARMHTEIEGPGVLNFWWATTARNNELQFLVDGVAKTSLYNRPGWEPASVALPSGSHRLEWKLTHSSAEAQAVTAWVDSVEIRDGVAPKIMSASSNYWFTPGERVALSVAAVGDDPLHYQWFAGTTPIPWATGTTLLLSPWDIVSEMPYSVTVSNYFGVVKSGLMTLRPRPRLRIETEAAGTFRLIWPRTASGFTLEQSADLTGAASWEVVDHPVVLTETECVVLVPAEPGTNQWFRLRLP